MITVGCDTYITLAEADEIVSQCHCSEPLADKWLSLADDEKESFLRNAAYRIDCLTYCSYKHNPDQPLQFPRGMSEIIPVKVRLAQAEEALAANDDTLLQRYALQQQGVTAVKLGNASESYDTAKKQSTGALLSIKAYHLLRQYLLGTAEMI